MVPENLYLPETLFPLQNKHTHLYYSIRPNVLLCRPFSQSPPLFPFLKQITMYTFPRPRLRPHPFKIHFNPGPGLQNRILTESGFSSYDDPNKNQNHRNLASIL